jgi:hypothetical protein
MIIDCTDVDLIRICASHRPTAALWVASKGLCRLHDLFFVVVLIFEVNCSCIIMNRSPVFATLHAPCRCISLLIIFFSLFISFIFVLRSSPHQQLISNVIHATHAPTHVTVCFIVSLFHLLSFRYHLVMMKLRNCFPLSLTLVLHTLVVQL